MPVQLGQLNRPKQGLSLGFLAAGGRIHVASPYQGGDMPRSGLGETVEISVSE